MRPKLAIVSTVVAVLLFLSWVGEANAEPRRFRQTRSTFTLGTALGSFLGNAVGTATKAGLGLFAQQAISSGYFGGAIRIGGTVFGTEQQALPFDSGLQTYSIAGGPRFVFPLVDAVPLTLFVQPEYAYVGVQSNTLIVETEGSNVLHGPGVQLGTQLFLGAGAIELGVAGTWLFPINSALVVVHLGGGFTGIL